MKKRNIFLLVLIILLAVVLSFYFVAAKTTFKNEVTDHLNMNEIRNLLVIKVIGDEADTAYVSEPTQIKQILTYLSEVELKRVFSFDRDNSELFVLMIELDGKMRYTINVYGNKYLSVTDHTLTNNVGSVKYKISSTFNAKTLQDLFK